MNDRPILLDYVYHRKKDNACPPFTYDRSQDINVIKTSTGIIPFIKSAQAVIATQTETRVQRETDDAEYNVSELMTKTEAIRERDDETMLCAELFTKTSAGRESDDDSLCSIAELYSKTFADRERDDEDDPTYHQ